MTCNFKFDLYIKKYKFIIKCWSYSREKRTSILLFHIKKNENIKMCIKTIMGKNFQVKNSV